MDREIFQIEGSRDREILLYLRLSQSVRTRSLKAVQRQGLKSPGIYCLCPMSIAILRKEEEALVYDMAPNPNEIKIGTRVIAHWSGVAAYLPGAVTKIEGNKYHVLYDDGDRLGNRLEQMRILKPPLYFGELIVTTEILKVAQYTKQYLTLHSKVH